MIIAYAGRSPLRNCLICRVRREDRKRYVDSWDEDTVEEREEGD